MKYQDILGVTTLITIAILIATMMSFIFDGLTWKLVRGLLIGIPLLIFVIKEWKRINKEDWNEL